MIENSIIAQTVESKELISSAKAKAGAKNKSSSNSARELNEFVIKSFNRMRLLALDFKIV